MNIHSSFVSKYKYVLGECIEFKCMHGLSTEISLAREYPERLNVTTIFEILIENILNW